MLVWWVLCEGVLRARELVVSELHSSPLTIASERESLGQFVVGNKVGDGRRQQLEVLTGSLAVWCSEVVCQGISALIAVVFEAAVELY